MNGLRQGQQVLATRMSEVEECISVQMYSDTIRHCLMRLDQHATDLEDLRERMRTHEWYHDLSEQESDDETQRTHTHAEEQGADAENRSGVENRPINRDTRRPRNAAQQHRAPRIMNQEHPNA